MVLVQELLRLHIGKGACEQHLYIETDAEMAIELKRAKSTQLVQ